MDSENINDLLNKYWNCQTSLEEEQQLHAYFKNTDVPEALKETAAWFSYLEHGRKKSIPDGSFEKGVLKSIRRPQRRIGAFMYNSMRIAAGVIVLVLAVWLVRLEVREISPADATDTYSDPDRAFEETKKALMMISKSFNTAEQHAKKINLFNEAQEELRTRNEEN